MDFNSPSVCFSLPWYEKATLLFSLFYPVLGVVVARRRLRSGQGSVVVLATLPLTIAAVAFWLGLSMAVDGSRIYGVSDAIVAGIGEALRPLLVSCLSTLLVLGGTIPYRVGGEKRPRNTLLTSIVIGAPFVLAAAGLVFGFVLSQSAMPPGSLAATVLGAALVALHLLAITLRVPPESRATAVTVFVLTVTLAVAIWKLNYHFQLQILQP